MSKVWSHFNFSTRWRNWSNNWNIIWTISFTGWYYVMTDLALSTTYFRCAAIWHPSILLSTNGQAGPAKHTMTSWNLAHSAWHLSLEISYWQQKWLSRCLQWQTYFCVSLSPDIYISARACVAIPTSLISSLGPRRISLYSTGETGDLGPSLFLLVRPQYVEWLPLIVSVHNFWPRCRMYLF